MSDTAKRPPVSENEAIPFLQGYVGLNRAAEMLGVSRQHSYKRASRYGKPGGFKTLLRIEGSSISVVAVSEIEAELAAAKEEIPSV